MQEEMKRRGHEPVKFLDVKVYKLETRRLVLVLFSVQFLRSEIEMKNFANPGLSPIGLWTTGPRLAWDVTRLLVPQPNWGTRRRLTFQAMPRWKISNFPSNPFHLFSCTPWVVTSCFAFFFPLPPSQLTLFQGSRMQVVHQNPAAIQTSFFPSTFAQDEIFDMVKPADPFRITLRDLINRWTVLGFNSSLVSGHFIRGKISRGLHNPRLM